jgi:hypothetical protein
MIDIFYYADFYAIGLLLILQTLFIVRAVRAGGVRVGLFFRDFRDGRALFSRRRKYLAHHSRNAGHGRRQAGI